MCSHVGVVIFVQLEVGQSLTSVDLLGNALTCLHTNIGMTRVWLWLWAEVGGGMEAQYTVL